MRLWSQQIAKEEALTGAKNEKRGGEFCPDYEKRHLAGFYNELAESKTQTGEQARAARAQATWKVYLLASMRPTTKEDLKQLLLKAKEGAPEGSEDDKATVWDFATQARIARSLAALDQPMPGRIRISEKTSQCYMLSKVQPSYPEGAKMARIQGDAILKVVVGQEGRVMEIAPISGQQMLVEAAMFAVKDWRWRPYLLSGQPVEFETQVTVKYTLSVGHISF